MNHIIYPAAAPHERVNPARPANLAEPRLAEPWLDGTAAPELDHGLGTSHPDPLRDALLESRQRWRDLVTMAADIAFETDADGRFVFVAPEMVFGWPATTLLGLRAEDLLAGSGPSAGFNPFRLTSAVRRRRAWLRRPDGTSICLAFAVAPLMDGEGRIVGARGVGQDVTEQDTYDAAIAAALRRGEVVDHILWRMRQEVLAPRMMQAALEGLSIAMGLEGAAVIQTSGAHDISGVLHTTGAGLPSVREAALQLLATTTEESVQTVTDDQRVVLVCPCQTRFDEKAGVVLWRAPNGRSLDADDLVLASSASVIIRVILEHEAIQREMARQARTDSLTGLLNRRAFIDEMGRRIDRLDREGLPGTLMFIDLDNFKALNDTHGHDLGDEALCLTAVLLRSTVRPADLVARFGGDEFALWLDGADELSAAERAEMLRINGPRALAHLTYDPESAVTMSIGIATRWPDRGEDVDTLIQRADQVMYQVKRAGRGHWRVFQHERQA